MSALTGVQRLGSYRPLGELATQIRETILPDKSDERTYVALEHIDAGDIVVRRQGTSAGVRSTKSVFRRGDVLYGKLRPYLDKAVLAPFDGLASTELLVLRARPDIDSQFLAFSMHSPRVLKHAIDTTAGVNHPRTSWESLRILDVYCPPIEEQRRIARILWTIQRAKQVTEACSNLAERLRSTLLTQLLSDGNTEAWQRVNLGDIAKIERGRFTHRPRNDPAFYGGEIPFIQTGDVTRGASQGGVVRAYTQTLNQRGLAVSKVFPRGTIAITIAANIGFTAILDFDSAFPDSIIGITPAKGVYSPFLSYYLSTQQPEMDRVAPRGTQKNINIEFLKPWPILLPSLDEQKRIAKAIHSVDQAESSYLAEATQIGEVFVSAFQTLVGSGS